MKNRALLALIEEFSDRCNSQRFTGTGEVWDLLDHIYTKAGGDVDELHDVCPGDTDGQHSLGCNCE